MENAVDALKMAAAILIFIIAIWASFSLFGTAKQTADSIISMRDKQEYLEAAELDNGILYTSSEAISSGKITGLTTNGDRIVKIDDVISTIYRYNKENYAVTIIDKNGDIGRVIARFDINTESYIANYNAYGAEFFDKYKDKVEANLKNDYCSIQFGDDDKIESLYEIKDENNTNTKYGAPWLISDKEIKERISKELSGEEYKNSNGQSFKREQKLFEVLSDKTIIEVTNEIDESKYLQYTDETGEIIKTDLPQQYEMPTVEIIYIID